MSVSLFASDFPHSPTTRITLGADYISHFFNSTLITASCLFKFCSKTEFSLLSSHPTLFPLFQSFKHVANYLLVPRDVSKY